MGCYTSVNGRFDLGTTPSSESPRRPLAAPTLPLAPTAELMTLCCPADCEEGALLVDVGTDYEHLERCETCDGSGMIEVCSGCMHVPWVNNQGVEVCACTTSDIWKLK